MRDARHIVAVILALCILVAFVSGAGVVRALFGIEPVAAADPELIAAWENIAFAIIGALSGYIAGRSNNE